MRYTEFIVHRKNCPCTSQVKDSDSDGHACLLPVASSGDLKDITSAETGLITIIVFSQPGTILTFITLTTAGASN